MIFAEYEYFLFSFENLLFCDFPKCLCSKSLNKLFQRAIDDHKGSLSPCAVNYSPLESRGPRNIVLSKFCSEIDRKFDVRLIACVSRTLDQILYL